MGTVNKSNGEQLLESLVREFKLDDTESRQKAITYLMQHKSISNTEIGVIKKFTRILTDIIENYFEMITSPIFDRIIEYHHQGIDKVHLVMEDPPKYGVKHEAGIRNLSVIEFRLYTHLGDCYKKRIELAEKEEEDNKKLIALCDKAYEISMIAGDLSIILAPISSSNSYHDAGNAAKKRLELAKKENEPIEFQIELAENMYHAFESAAIVIEESDKVSSGHNYSFAADGAEARYLLSKEKIGGETRKNLVLWAKRAYDYRLKHIEMVPQTEKIFNVNIYYFLGSSAQDLLDCTKDTEYAKTAITWYNKFLNEDSIKPYIASKKVRRGKRGTHTLFYGTHPKKAISTMIENSKIRCRLLRIALKKIG